MPASESELFLDALPPGATLQAGRFVVEGVLGRGGFGITYAARDCATGCEIALKEFFPAPCRRENGLVLPAANPEAWERARAHFGRGARIMTRLRHPAIVRFHEHFAENGTLYAAMNRLHGVTLQERIAGGSLPETEAIAVIEEVAGALEAVHRMHLLHLDIKPENVMLCDEADGARRVVLFDFDLLQDAERGNDALTRPLSPAQHGTPGYAPLEQYAQHAPLSPATDIYALGATFYHLLTGQTPPAATDRALGETLPAPRDLFPHLSPSSNEAALRALEVQPARRPQSVGEFLRVLHGEVAAPVAPPFRAPVSAPPAVAPLAGAEGWHLVGLLSEIPAWPAICACCGAPAAREMPLRSEGRAWPVPYCARCAAHVATDRKAARGATWGMIVSLSVALIGVLLQFVADVPFAGILLPPPAVVAFFTAMAYGALKGAVADAQMRPQCPARSLAVARAGQSERGTAAHLWKFKSRAFAEAFIQENGANVVRLT